jgi:hypothetical protein
MKEINATNVRYYDKKSIGYMILENMYHYTNDTCMWKTTTITIT